MTDEFDELGDETDWTAEERAAMDRLRDFREDESRLSPEARARLWRQLADDPEVRDHLARHLMGNTDPAGSPRGSDPYASSGARSTGGGGARVGTGTSTRRRLVPVVLAVAASIGVVALLAVTAPTPDPPEVATGRTPSTTEPVLVPSLSEIADRADARSGQPVLGFGDAYYAHRIAVVETTSPTGGEPTTISYETWIGIDGAGRRIVDPGDPALRTDTPVEAGSAEPLRLGGALPAEEALILPTDDVDELITRLRELIGAEDVSTAVVGVLAEAGIDSESRGALFRVLDRIGFRPATDQLARGATYEGPGPDGTTYRLVLDDDTVPVTFETSGSGGTRQRTSYREIETRSDLS